MNLRVLIVFISSVIAISTSGCASNAELARVRTDVLEARRTADQALNVAEEANKRSERTEEMVQRSYRHSMRK